MRYINPRFTYLLTYMTRMLCSHKWIVGEWTECRTRLNCGQGMQNRTVLCVRVYGNDYCLLVLFLLFAVKTPAR